MSCLRILSVFPEWLFKRVIQSFMNHSGQRINFTRTFIAVEEMAGKFRCLFSHPFNTSKAFVLDLSKNASPALSERLSLSRRNKTFTDQEISNAEQIQRISRRSLRRQHKRTLRSWPCLLRSKPDRKMRNTDAITHFPIEIVVPLFEHFTIGEAMESLPSSLTFVRLHSLVIGTSTRLYNIEVGLDVFSKV